jgi:hypothetical protein
MNCANHPQVPATAFCRTCGKALCDECKRDVRGVIYCEDCIVARLGDTMPPAAAAGVPGTPGATPYVAAVVPGAPNPALAGVLAGFFPFGVGQVYNGQIGKAIVHCGPFALLVVMIDNAHGLEPLFGFAMAFFYFYQIFDAVRSAKAKQLGLPTPDPLGIYRGIGVHESSPGGDGVAAMARTQRIPTAAVVLIGLWPLILIFIGVRMFMRNRPAGS